MQIQQVEPWGIFLTVLIAIKTQGTLLEFLFYRLAVKPLHVVRHILQPAVFSLHAKKTAVSIVAMPTLTENDASMLFVKS